MNTSNSQNTNSNEAEFLTTTELSKLCGVSRITIINWLRQGKVKSVKTLGGHRRIPRTEVESLLEALHIKSGTSESIDRIVLHCWQSAEKMKCEKKCKSCMVFMRRVDYCFFIVQRLGKGWIHCEGSCLDCAYFKGIFEKMESLKHVAGKAAHVSPEEAIKKAKDYASGVGYDIGQGMLGIKKKFDAARQAVIDNVLNAKKSDET